MSANPQRRLWSGFRTPPACRAGGGRQPGNDDDVQELLKGSGFQLLAAGTTREAEDSLDRVLPAAIVLDIVLRSEDTWAFVAKLKQDERTRNIPILIVSTIDDQGEGISPRRGSLPAETHRTRRTHQGAEIPRSPASRP